MTTLGAKQNAYADKWAPKVIILKYINELVHIKCSYMAQAGLPIMITIVKKKTRNSATKISTPK